MSILVYLLLYTSCLSFATWSKRESLTSNRGILNTHFVYLLFVAFSFIVGTRYMVGVDYPSYMEIIESGKNHYYYGHIELIPRKLIDVVKFFGLEFYWWFILMAFFQIYFLARATRGLLVNVFPWMIFIFLVLYLSFYMNVVRQSVALSCFLCAVTYAQERKLRSYLLFFLVGFLCHSSIIVWLPIYWILNRELFPNTKVQYLLLIASAFILPPVIERLIDATRLYWELFGYGYQSENFSGSEKDIDLGSGLGMMLRYVRWCIIIAYYNKMKEFYGTNHFILFYNLFFIGVCFDYSSAFNILFTRIFMFGSFLEIVILPYLLYYLSKIKNTINDIVFIFLLILLIVLVLYPFFTEGVEWRFVWDRFTN